MIALENSKQHQVSSAILDQVNTIYCTQVHLYERCTEVIGLKDFVVLKRNLQEAVATSLFRIKKIDLFFKISEIDYSFECCESLIGYLEDLFNKARVGTNDLHRRQLMARYLLFNYGNARCAKEIIKLSMPELKEQGFTTQFNKDVSNLLTQIML